MQMYVDGGDLYWLSLSHTPPLQTFYCLRILHLPLLIKLMTSEKKLGRR